MKSLRTGIIGCGHFAKRHAAHLAALEQTQLVGFCDQVIENANAYNQMFANGEGQVYTEVEDMFKKLNLDLVYIVLPPYAHENEVELATRYGVHFLIEKPIALTMDLALKMAEQVRVSGVKCQVGFMYRFGQATQWLKEYLVKNNKRTHAYMTATFACNSLHSWWWRDQSKSGGQLVEQAIHILDLARFFLGEPSQVFSVQENLFHKHHSDYTVEDASATFIRFKSGDMATITATNGAIPNRWDYDWRVFMPELTADFTDANHAVFHQTKNAWPSTYSINAEKDMYLAETLDLIQAIQDDKPTTTPIEEGVRSLNLALAAVQSAKLNRPVDIVTPI